MKKVSLTRKVVAFVSSLALAGALIPAFAISAWAEDSPALVITTKNVNADAEDPGSISFTQEQLDAMATAASADLTQVDTKYLFYKKSSKTPGIYVAKKYIPAADLLAGIAAWKSGSTLTFVAEKNGEVDESNNELFAYEAINEERYFFGNYTFSGETGKNSTTFKHVLDAEDLNNERAPSSCPAVLSLEYADTQMTTAGQFAAEAIQNVAGSSKDLRWFMGQTQDAYQTEGPVAANVSVGGIMKIRVNYKTDLSVAKVTVPNAVYTGKVLKPAPVVDGKTLVEGTDYTAVYKNNVNAGKASMTITGMGGYEGKATATFTIAKAANPMKLAPASKTLKAKKVKKGKKSVTIKPADAKGKVTYTLSKKAKKAKMKVSAKGKVAIKKGTKKGSYKITVKAAGDTNYNAASSTFTIKIK